MKTKILLLINQLGIGGAENMVYNLAKELTAMNEEASIVCCGSKLNNALEAKAESVCKVTYLNLTGKVTLQSYSTVLKEIKRQSPDVIHAHLGGVVFAAPLSILLKIPLVITAHTRPDVAFPKKIVPVLKFCMKFTNCKMVAVSKENLLPLKKYFGGCKQKYAYVNNGIDLSRFYRKQHEDFTFINVARQDENKNQIAILKAFTELYKENKKIKLYLVGDGPCHKMLEQEISKYGLENVVIMPGNVSNVEDYYALADAYVQASHREALPLTTLEAMASSLPIIATDVGGMKDIVKDNGILIPDNDDNALLCAMKKLLECEDSEVELLEKSSRKIVQDYSSNEMAKKYGEIYSELLV